MNELKTKLTASVQITKRGCWEGRTRTKYGYARICHSGTVEYAHRLAWRLYRGPIPKGSQVLHTCDNPPCCNPKHLWLGSHQDNMVDRDLKARHAHGNKHGRARLHEVYIPWIRKARKAGAPLKALANLFGVDARTISGACTGVTWRHT